jgi:hypothetical protein
MLRILLVASTGRVDYVSSAALLLKVVYRPPRLEQAVKHPQLLMVELGQLVVTKDRQDLGVLKAHALEPVA